MIISNQKINHKNYIFKYLLSAFGIVLNCLTTGYIFAQVTAPPDFIFNSRIKFAHIYQKGSNQTIPVIELNSDQQMRIEFDDLLQETNRYSYRVFHCNYDWSPSGLNFMQYMTGFESFEIFDYKLSTNTTYPYTHYWFDFPNEYMRPVISGNFVLQVFESDHPENILFQRRFMMVDKKLMIDAKVRYASNVELRNTHQEIYFTIINSGLMIQDFNNDLKVVIMQNNRWDNIIENVAPQFISGNKYIYNYSSGETAFPAGNQYRFLDLKSLMVPMGAVQKITTDRGKFHVLMQPELNRKYMNYLFRPDINGRFAIYNQDTYNTSIDPDYAYVYFSVPTEEPYDKDIYLSGGFSFGELLEEYKMTYNPNYRMYELKTLLKQGYYNYLFLTKSKKEKEGKTEDIEGDFAETENDYTIFVYVREAGDVAHKLAGISFINSMNNR